MYSGEEIKSKLNSVGITEGHFTINLGAGKQHYILEENGTIINVDSTVEKLNQVNWIDNGQQVGDKINVYGNDYIVDHEGHIKVSVNDHFTTTQIICPSKMEINQEMN